jgi:hypothetical protein
MALRREKALLDIHSLNAGMFTCTPNMYFRSFFQQIGGLRARRVDNVVDMHLVEVDLALAVGQVEDLAADV